MDMLSKINDLETIFTTLNILRLHNYLISKLITIKYGRNQFYFFLLEDRNQLY